MLVYFIIAQYTWMKYMQTTLIHFTFCVKMVKNMIFSLSFVGCSGLAKCPLLSIFKKNSTNSILVMIIVASVVVGEPTGTVEVASKACKPSKPLILKTNFQHVDTNYWSQLVLMILATSFLTIAKVLQRLMAHFGLNHSTCCTT